MILVVLGTQDKSFHRLLDEVERLIDKGIIKEEVIAQIGYTEFTPRHIKVHHFLNREEMKTLQKEANYVITHAGVGSIMECLEQKKKIIVVPRLKKYKEHTNDHQLQILNTFCNSGYVIGAREVEELETCIQKLKKFKPKQLQHKSNQKMINIIEDYIANL